MKRRQFISLPLVVLFLTLTSTVLASNTWYVDGVNGNDGNDCQTALTACKTIGHAISLAASGGSIIVAAATYTENLTISFSLNVIGSGANTTIIDGGGVNRVATIPNSSVQVTISNVTIRNGSADHGGGIFNAGTLTIYGTIISGNSANHGFHLPHSGGGIFNSGILTISYSTVSGNIAADAMIGGGGGIYNSGGVVMISNTSITGNAASGGRTIRGFGHGAGGGILNTGALTISNSTLAGNGAGGFNGGNYGGAIYSSGTVTISNSTVAGNDANTGGGISTYSNFSVQLQNTIVANNSGGNCSGYIIKSLGYNLSSDNTCNFNGPGDLNNTDPKLGVFGYNGGPTQTIPLLSGSPAIDAGNPSGCRDAQGNLLKTDQRGMPRPDPGDTGGCDMGAYESQN